MYDVHNRGDTHTYTYTYIHTLYMVCGRQRDAQPMPINIPPTPIKVEETPY